MSVCFGCCVLSGRGHCDESITCPEESYRLWCVVACALRTSAMARVGPQRHKKKLYITLFRAQPEDGFIRVAETCCCYKLFNYILVVIT